MTDEEKKALKRIDYIQDFIIENGQYNADVNDMEYFSRIKNLIEKQSKEIEELNKSDESKEQSSMKYYNLYKELVDKIKEEIEAIKTNKLRYFHIAPENWAINILQSLLEKED